MTSVVTTETAAEVAARFRCSTQKVRQEAAKHQIGVNLGGRAGWRFTPEDVAALHEALRPEPPAPAPGRRRRRRH